MKNITIKTPFVWSSIVILLFSSIEIYAAGFDCAKASTPVEVSICNDAELSEADDLLTAMYTRAHANNPKEREIQIAWLRDIRNKCGDKSCLLDVYQTRITALAIEEATAREKSESAAMQPSVASAAPIATTPQVIGPPVIAPNALDVSNKIETPVSQSVYVESKLTITPAVDRESASQNLAEPGKKFNSQYILYVIIAVIAGWIWHKFIRMRCEKCKSTNFEIIDDREVDRWRGIKKVSETNSRGTKTRHLSTTYIKRQYRYECRECQNQWLVEKKEEL